MMSTIYRLGCCGGQYIDRVNGENNPPAATDWDMLSHKDVWSTPHHVRESNQIDVYPIIMVPSPFFLTRYLKDKVGCFMSAEIKLKILVVESSDFTGR